jgi:hypothetical protein
MTLEMTPVGKWLNKTNLYSPNSPFTLSQADKIWEAVSKRPIQQANGRVRPVVGQVRPKSIYKTEQSGILTNNQITGLDELNLKPKFTFSNR